MIAIPIKKIVLVLLLGMVIALIRAFMGLDTARLSPLISNVEASEFEFMKLLIALGSLLEAFFIPLLFLTFTSFIYTILFDEVTFRHALIVSTVSLFIFQLGKLAMLPIEIWFGLDSTSSPFAFGLIANVLGASDFYIEIGSHFSLFLFWSIILHIYAFSQITTERKFFIVLISIAVHLLVIVFSILKTFFSVYITLI